MAVLVSRTGGVGKNYSFSWEFTAKGQLLVDGKPLPVSKEPTLYYKENGKLKSKQLENSGVWSAFFTQERPSGEQLKKVFDELERP